MRLLSVFSSLAFLGLVSSADTPHPQPLLARTTLREKWVGLLYSFMDFAALEPVKTEKASVASAVVPESIVKDVESETLLSKLTNKDPSLLSEGEMVFLKMNEIYSFITKDLPEEMVRNKPPPYFFVVDSYPGFKISTYKSYPNLKAYHALLYAIFLKGPYKTVEECKVPKLIYGGRAVPLNTTFEFLHDCRIAFKANLEMTSLDELDKVLKSDEPYKTVKQIHDYAEGRQTSQ